MSTPSASMTNEARPPRPASSLALNPVAAVRRRFRGWWQARLPLTDTLALTQRNVYILPTRPGLMLAATLMVLLVASINYQLNLGYLLTFLLAGSAIAGMYVCHATLRGVRLTLSAPEPVFAGSNAPVRIVLTNERKATRYGIGLAVLDDSHEDRWAWTDVPGLGSATVSVAFQPQRRGLARVPPLTAETRFPLGTFRVWTVWRPAAQVLVYPAPACVKSSQSSRRCACWVSRLSRLAAWVLQADKLGVDYGLRLPGQQIAPDSGEAHRRRCLEALALC